MKEKWFAFEVKGGYDKRDSETYHWVVTSKYATKKEVFEAYNTKGYARKVKTVYTLEQLLKTFGKAQTKHILEKTKPHWASEIKNRDW